MSTIATPREPPSSPMPRPVPSHQTPTSSARPSLDNPRSQTTSPNRNNTSTTSSPATVKRNRAALREYYKIKNQAPPTLEVTEDSPEDGGHSEVPQSELDAPGFDADAYVAKAAAESSLADLLRTYARVLAEARALDAEKKALVYDNYSKLITATETIRKMRENMDPLNPMASTLDPAIAHIYTQASSIRDAMRKNIPPPEERGVASGEAAGRRRRTRELAMMVSATPARLRELVAEGKRDEAVREWELPRRLLVSWKEKGLGGDDVTKCLAAGDAALAVESSDDGDDDDDDGEDDDDDSEEG